MGFEDLWLTTDYIPQGTQCCAVCCSYPSALQSSLSLSEGGWRCTRGSAAWHRPSWISLWNWVLAKTSGRETTGMCVRMDGERKNSICCSNSFSFPVQLSEIHLDKESEAAPNPRRPLYHTHAPSCFLRFPNTCVLFLRVQLMYERSNTVL